MTSPWPLSSPLRLAAAGLLAASLLLARTAGGAAEDAADPLAAARAALIRRDCAAAIELLAAVSASSPEQEVEIRLLRAAARLHSGDAEGAAEELRQVPHAPKARFRLGDALALLLRHDEALAETRAVVEALRQPERRHEIARYYLDAAREVLSPPPGALPGAAFQPDHALAYALLLKAEELDALGAEAPAVRLDLLRCADALDRDGKERAERARKFLAEHAAHAEVPEALFLLGRAQAKLGERFAARESWLRLGREHAASTFAPRGLDALTRLFDGAGLPDRGDVHYLAEAVRLLEAGWPEHDLTAMALYLLAERQAQDSGLRAQAQATLERLATRQPQHELAGKARLLQAQLKLEDQDAASACALLRDFLRGRPVDQLSRKAIQRLESILFSEAERFFVRGQSEEKERCTALFARARELYAEFLKQAPADQRVPRLLFQLAHMELLEERVPEAIVRWNEVAARFPGSNEAAEALFHIGETYGERLHDYPLAFAALSGVPDQGGWKVRAEQLGAQLRAPLLGLECGRVFRSDEKPAVTLKARNVEKVTLSLYRVDLEDFFLATGSLNGIGALDVGLIKPDASFEVDVADYRPFHQFEQAVAIDQPQGAGAVVVAARAGLLEARTVVIRTDLETLAVATVEEARVLASNRQGGGTLDDASTRLVADGTLLPAGARLPEDFSAAALTAFSVRGADVAQAQVATQDLARPTKPARRGWLLAERVTARPGETVAVLGLAREPAELGWRPPAGEGYRLDWIDRASERKVASRAPAFSAGGFFRDELALDLALAGERTFEVRLVAVDEEQAEQILAAAEFLVGPFPAAEVRASFDLGSGPLFTGEERTVRARLIDASGEPLAGEPVSVSVAGEAREAIADRGGQVELKIEARHTVTPGWVRVDVAARGSSDTAYAEVLSRTALLALQGAFADGIPAVAGEPYRVEFKTRNAAGDPLAVGTRWAVLEPDLLAGSAVLTTLEARSGEDGAGSISFTPKRAGEHVVQAEFADAFGNPARLEWRLAVAGDGDGTPIHLVPERIDPIPGAELVLRVHSEVETGPATLLVHSDRLEAATPVLLERGLNRFAVKIPARALRNLRITCAATRGFDVHLPTIEVRPALRLDLELKTDRKSYATRNEVKVSLRARAPSGGPAEAEVALILVHADEEGQLRAALSDPTDVFLPWLEGSFVAIGSSAAFRPPAIAEVLDPAIERALTAIAHAAETNAAAVMVQTIDLQGLVDQHELTVHSGSAGFLTGMGARLRQAGKGQTAQFGGRRAYKGPGDAVSAARGPIYIPAPAAFLAGLKTDQEGRLEQTLVLPQRAGRYSLLAVAAGGDCLFGQAEASLDAQDPVSVTVLAPPFLRSGEAPDRSTVRVLLSESAGNGRLVKVLYEERHAGATRQEERGVELAAHGSAEVDFDLVELARGIHEITVMVEGQEFCRTVEVLDRRPLVRAALAGEGSGSFSAPLPAMLGEPEGDLLVALHASPGAALLALAEEDAACDDPLDLEAAAWRVWVSCEALLATSGFGPASAARIGPVSDDARRRVDHVLAFHPFPAGNVHGAPVALAALAQARRAGLEVPERVLQELDAALAQELAKTTAPLLRTWLMFCRGFQSKPEYAQLNRLFRDRAALDTASLALLAWLLAESERPAEAAEVLAVLESRPAAAGGRFAFTEDAGAEGPRVTADEIAALALAAAARSSSASAALAEARAALLARMGGAGLTPLAGIVFFGSGAPAFQSAGEVRVTLSGTEVGTASLVEPWRSAFFEVPAARAADSAEITFQPSGSGSFLWNATRCCRAAEAAPEAPPHGLGVKRLIERPFGVHDGRRYAIGDSIVAYEARGELTTTTERLAPGRKARVHISVHWKDAPLGDHWFFAPLPAGCLLQEGSVQGADQVVRAKDGLWVRLARPHARSAGRSFFFVLHSYGRRGEETKLEVSGKPALTVVAAGEDPDAGVFPSPDERYQAGRDAFQRNELARARELLLPLADLPLEAEPSRETTRMLMLSAVAAGEKRDTVRFFEILKEHDPAFVVPFDTMLEVGRAYAALGEAERARQVFLGVADATFLEEAQVVGQLERSGRTRRAYAAMARLLSEYGDTAAVRSTLFALGQHAYSAAGATDPAVTSEGDRLSRNELFRIAVRALEEHLAGDPFANEGDEVALTLCNALVDMGRHAEGRRLAAEAAARFPASRFQSSWSYIRAHASLALRDLDEALRLAEELAEPRPERREDAMAARLRAMGRHMAAQIHHAQGDLEKARQAYAQVKADFPDAAATLAWLERQGLKMPDISRAPRGEPLVIEFELRGRADALEVKVYPVDLRLLYLRHRTFDRLASVELAGIAPALVQSFPLAQDSSSQTLKATLDVPEVGAYLLVARAGDLHARGMAIRSDLAIDVVEEGGAVRVHAQSAPGAKPQEGALVTLVGSQNPDFVTRRTDLRGICEASGLAGRVAVIAEREGHYAFYQGAVYLEEPQTAQWEVQDKANFAEKQVRQEADRMGEQLREAQQVLDEIRLKNADLWSSNTNREQRGVEVERARK
ncbi:MAG: hypothetical protein HY812_05355 [Planctomycetes bacterium]|nr:hypothetical protein [Planctomycetota bacterium]